MDQRKESQEGLEKGSFRPYQSYKGAGKDFIQNRGKAFFRTKAREKTKKENAMTVFIPDPDSQPLKHPMRKDMAMSGNRMSGLPAIGLTILGLQLLDGLARQLRLRAWWYQL